MIKDIYGFIDSLCEGVCKTTAPESVIRSDMWLDELAHPLLLEFGLYRNFRTAWIAWEPETIWTSLGIEIPRVNRDKIMAIKTCRQTDEPWHSWNVFEKVAMAFNNKIPRFDLMQAPNSQDLAFTCKLLGVLNNDLKFDTEVHNYILAHLMDSGVYTLWPYFVTKEDDFGMCKQVIDEAKKYSGDKTYPEQKDEEMVNVQVRKVLYNLAYVTYMEDRLEMQLRKYVEGIDFDSVK